VRQISVPLLFSILPRELRCWSLQRIRCAMFVQRAFLQWPCQSPIGLKYSRYCGAAVCMPWIKPLQHVAQSIAMSAYESLMLLSRWRELQQQCQTGWAVGLSGGQRPLPPIVPGNGKRSLTALMRQPRSSLEAIKLRHIRSFVGYV